ncbi:MAG: response regulator [Cyanobacteriota bacterium]|nr:response regulator [Cyanobacteriota bacterium]
MKKDPNRTAKGTITIVDDTPDNLRLLSKMLTDAGYDIKRAINGKMALMGIDAAPPDLILLDIMMPELSGYEVCQQLKSSELTREIPVIFLSALSEAFDKVKAFDVGGVDYITKPFEMSEVLARVENHLAIRRLQNELKEQNARLRVSEAKNRALLDAIPDLMFRINSSGVFLDCREACGNGVTPSPLIALDRSFSENVVGKQIEEVFDRDLAVWTMQFVKETLSADRILVGEYVRQAADSEGLRMQDRWHHYEARYVRSGPDEVLAILRDISDRKQAEADLRKSQALLLGQKQQLERTVEELQRSQAQLVQNAKMVSLGQLVAGVAHEINNPINFIYGNLSHLTQYARDLLELLELYEEALPEPPEEIKALVEELEVEFLKEDLQKLMGSMKVGSQRIYAIVEALKNFSRLGEAELKAVDLHEGIDSTLMVLQHRLSGGSAVGADSGGPRTIEVIKEYGDLPLLECYPREINQVFLNILGNAIDALESRFSSYVVDAKGDGQSLVRATEEQKTTARGEKVAFPTITIRTQLMEEGLVAIAISDNGPGMTEAVKERVFDPFFTTKEVGSGTGLGMSISYSIIVEKHGGRLRCESVEGEGTSFIIELLV